MKTIELGGFVIKATVDDDGHLTLTVDHEDGTEVFDIGEDVSSKDTQWAARFTTEAIG